MRYGPLSIQRASVLSKGLRRPKRSSTLKIGEQRIGGEKSYVIKIPETHAYARYGELEYQLVMLCDGTRTPAELAEELPNRYEGASVSEQDVLDFIDATDPAMWEKSLGERNIAVLQKIRDERKGRVDKSSLTNIAISGWNPNRFLERVHPYLAWMYTPGFIVATTALFIVMFAIILLDYARIRADTLAFYSLTTAAPYDIFLFWVLLLVVSFFHECGHGLTCKHYGGDVESMGFLLLYFMPAFFTETSDQLLFDSTSKKEWVIFAGMWIELVLCGVATVAWVLMPPGSFWGNIFYKTLLITGVSGVFFNLNPLMKFDGYYALAQYLQMDNLREDSIAYVQAWARKYLLFSDIDLPIASRRHRRIYLIFGFAAFFYTIFVLFVVLGWARNAFVKWFGDTWGYLATGVVLYLMLRKRIRGALPTLHSAWQSTKESLMSFKSSGVKIAVAAIILIALLAWPGASKVSSDFVLEPIRRAEIHATVPGWISSVPVKEGQQVQAGEILAELKNPDLDARAAVVSGQMSMAQGAFHAAQATGKQQVAAEQSAKAQTLGTELNEIRARQAALVIRAPFAGFVASPQIEQRIGEYIEQGGALLTLADRSQMKARILVRDWEIADVRVGEAAKLNVLAYPFTSYAGSVQRISPAAAADIPVGESKLVRFGQETTNFIGVVLDFPNPDGVLHEGFTGTAKIYGPSHSLGWRTGRAMYRWMRSLIW